MSGSSPGRREVAYRLFAAEFDDAEFSYSESDEERAPNYVVTPTGARVNRLFAVGVLTEVDDVNPEMVRGRVVDPTGAFVTYAGQYQPDALAFLERADPPTFVALSGKARTFEPDDDDVVYSSVRPESVNEVDAETRDRWIVTAAERTVERIGVVASAIEAELSGDQLRAALTEAGVDERLADGVALALEYYDTTPAYLGALRRTALDAARVVAGELDEVGSFDVAPDEAGGPGAATAAELATLDLSGAPSPATAAAAADAGESPTSDAGASADDGGESIEVSEPDGDVESGSTGETSEPATGADTATEPEAAETEATAEPETATAAETETTAEPEFSESDAGDGSPETAPSTEPESESEPTAESAADEGEEPGEFEPGEFDLDEETRREVEEEYGTEFSTADEVEEADIETPEPEPEPEPDTGAAESDGADAETAPDSEGVEPEAETEEEPDAGDDEVPEESAGEVDLEDAVMDAMETVGDGEGADREELVAAVVDEYGVDPESVEDAIQDALMSGRCYEPTDGTLKAI